MDNATWFSAAESQQNISQSVHINHPWQGIQNQMHIKLLNTESRGAVPARDHRSEPADPHLAPDHQL